MPNTLRSALQRACGGLLLSLAALGAAPAHASSTPNAYTYYAFPAGTPPLYDVTFSITVDQDPGHAANVFWSNQFGFAGGLGGYLGMQSNGGPKRTFLFSIWNATEARAGDAGSYCLNFGGEGVGKSCRTQAIDWVQGHTYRFHVAGEGNQWFGVTITDATTGRAYKLGSIQVKSDTVNPSGMIDWTEYFEWNDPTASCFNQPYARVTFGVPVGNGGTIAAHVSGSKASTGDCLSTVTQVPGGSVQTTAIGNSVRGPIVGLQGKVVNIAGGLTAGAHAVLYPANGGANQSWVLGHDHTVRTLHGLCLDTQGAANGAQVIAATCNNGASQQWQVNGLELVNTASGRCLHVEGRPIGGRHAAHPVDPPWRHQPAVARTGHAPAVALIAARLTQPASGPQRIDLQLPAHALDGLADLGKPVGPGAQ